MSTRARNTDSPRRERRRKLPRATPLPRQRAAALRADWVRRNKGPLVVQAVVGLALTPLALVLPVRLSGIVLGGLLVFVPAAIWYEISILSGASTNDMGALAEDWTGHELRRLHRRGWTTVEHTKLRYRDVDHVAVGPAGVLVVDTKWRSDENAFGTQFEGLDSAELVRDAREIEGIVRAHLGEAPVRTVIVLWGAASRALGRREREVAPGVLLIAGEMLREWLEGLASLDLRRPDLDSATSALQSHILPSDSADAVAAVRGVRDQVVEVSSAVCVGLVSFFATLFALHAGTTAWALASAIVALVALELYRRATFRLMVLGGVLGAIGSTGFVLAAWMLAH